MRKIETQMNQAVANNKSWQSGNTSVSFNEETGESIVRLHGNKIAVIGDDFLQIFDGVFQKNYEWFIKDNNVTRDFESGYIFA